MRRAIFLVTLLATALWAPTAEKSRVSRAALAAMEKSFDGRIERFLIDNPFMLLGATRGVYLEGYGAVFTAEVNLVTTPVLSPFRPQLTKQELAKLRQTKLDRLPRLKQIMREMLLASAASLDTVPANERVTVGVSLFYFTWEDSTGLPAQILMEAQRQSLLDIQTGRIGRAASDTIIREQEF